MSHSNPRVVEVASSADFPGSIRSDQRRAYLALGAAILMALLVGAGLKLLKYASIPDRGYRGGAERVAVTPGFSHTFHAATPDLRLANPGLLPSTPSRARLQTVVAGRSDPFASVLTPGQVGAIANAVVTPIPSPMVVPPLPQNLTGTTVPTTASAAKSGPSTLPERSGSSALTVPLVGDTPQGNTPQGNNRLNPQPISALDQIVVTGVVQVGNQISVIITEPGNPGGRRVTVGETLAAGQVRLQRVDLSAGEPLVILRHRGSDYYRSIGRGATL